MATTALSVTWDDRKPRPKPIRRTLALALSLLFAGSAPAAASTGPDVTVIVTRAPRAGAAADRAVARLGGDIDSELAIIDSFTARVPAASLSALRSDPAVSRVTPNAPVQMLASSFDPATDAGSIHVTTQRSGIAKIRAAGMTGQGITVALIDTGISRVNGLRTNGKVIHGPDLSFESQAANLRNLDTYGHGTHMAGIIAGRDDAAQAPYDNPANFVGVAPEARVLSLKVADHRGATDVSTIIAAIDWVVQHRNDNGMNVRVMNLSFGTDTTQSYLYDPLAHAAEAAWRAGIVVVSAAGNGGTGTARMESPANDPRIISVGSVSYNDTAALNDDPVSTFSSAGDGTRNPDLLAPGKSIASLRAPGSFVDEQFGAAAAVGDGKLMRGSGTSQASAYVSGVAALLLQHRPWLTPDQVKAQLVAAVVPLPGISRRWQGAGSLSVGGLLQSATPGSSTQTFPAAKGTGSLQSSRGSMRVSIDGSVLSGEKDIFGKEFNATAMAAARAGSGTWNSDGSWNGSRWTGSSWSSTEWNGSTWSGCSWSGSTWSGSSWSSYSFSANVWDGSRWTGTRWTGSSWSGSTWSGSTWSNTNWQ